MCDICTVVVGDTLKQPKPLVIFFLTEMWERYGFYVIQSLLALYLSHDFGFSDSRTYALVGAFTALTYVSPIIGGSIADKYLGQKISIIMGAVILFISYILLSINHTLMQLYFALAGVSVGTGLLKPNISSLLGNLYPENDNRRESGFTLFYMGITLGIILGTTLPSTIVHLYGWPASFASAASGIILALIIFITGIKLFKIQNYAKIDKNSNKQWPQSLIIIISFWLIAYVVLDSFILGLIIFIGVSILSAAYIIKTAKAESEQQRKNTMSILYLCIISVIFWTFYFQMFSSLTLFINRLVIPVIGGFKIPAPYYVTIQSVGMLFFGAIFIKILPKKLTNSVAYSASTKFLIAICLMLVAYSTLLLSIVLSADNALISPLFLIVTYLLISIAELLLSPIGLSAITQLASRKRVSTMMGIFFISLGIGGYLSGVLAKLTAVNNSDLNIETMKTLYLHGFTKVTAILAIGTLISAWLTTHIKKLHKET